MGVEGLLRSLAEHALKRPVALPLSPPGETPVASKKGVLLCDASIVQYHIQFQHEHEVVDVEAAGVREVIYSKTLSFVRLLQRTGLRLVFVADSVYEPQHAANYVLRRRRRFCDGNLLSPACESAFLEALVEAGVELHLAAKEADRTVLAYYKRHGADVFAILTGDSDFLIYGCEAMANVRDLLIEPHSITFYLYNCGSAWAAWRRSAEEKEIAFLRKKGGGGGKGLPTFQTGPVPMLQRAQVAAVMGNDESKALRSRMAGRQYQPGVISSAHGSACRVLLAPPAARLSHAFFQQTLALKRWSDADQASFTSVVDSYLNDVKECSNTDKPWAEWTLCAASLPAIRPEAASALARVRGPAYLRCEAAAGMFVLSGSVTEAALPELQRVRAAAVSALFASGCAQNVFEVDVRDESLTRILAASSPAPATIPGWIVPAVGLPDLPVTDKASALAALPLPAWVHEAGSLADKAAAAGVVQRACPTLTDAHAALYAALALVICERAAADGPSSAFAAMALTPKADDLPAEERDSWEDF